MQNWCRDCKKQNYHNTRARGKALKAAYYVANKERLTAANKAWAVANPEKITAIKDKWLVNNREQRLAGSRASYKRNYDKNREKIYANARNRRALKRNAPINDYTAAQWQECLETFNHHCAYCLLPFTADRPATQDHMQSLIHGGSHTAANIIPACRSCNSTKQHRTLLGFAPALLAA